MVKSVILHIGMHKTGSTSIQQSLQGYDDGKAFYGRFDGFNHSIPIITAFSKDSDGYHVWRKRGVRKDAIKGMRAAFLDVLKRDLGRKNRETLVLSGEGVSMMSNDDKAELIAFMNSHVERVQVICYVRDPVSYAASFWQQKVQSGTTTFPDIVPSKYRRALHKFASLLPGSDLIVRSFSRDALRGGNVVEDFCEVCGLDFRRVSEKSSNASLTLPALKLVVAFNESNDCNQGDEVVAFARNNMVNRLGELYQDGERIDSSRFSGVADTSQLDYLKARFGIAFAGVSEQRKGNAAEILAWLRDIDDVDLGVLDKELRDRGIEGRFDDAPAKLNRLFYSFVCDKEPFFPVAVRKLKNAHSVFVGRFKK
ncbi:MAG: hypothetical protein C0606_17405 [Hyphomicrobiales bacterium]|nr:MAG: hypothetical protein C0606_17405 [Hyphomicrobiales bacterium]